jgi:outer membrane lipoprotein carrier protein
MIALLSVLLTLGLPPVKIDVAELMRRLEARYRSAKTLEAAFLERYIENGQTVRVEAGTAYFRRPGKMRWEYERPEKDLFLVDGKTAWFYVPTDHTVTRMPAKQSTDFRTPLALLAGEMKVSRVCARVELAESPQVQSEEDVLLRCFVRGEQQSKPGTSDGAQNYDQIFFEIARSSGDLERITIRQAGGVEVQFQFRDWKFDPPLPQEMFRFVPPPGVAIVNGELSQGD